MQTIDPEPGAEHEIDKRRKGEQSSLLLATTRTLPSIPGEPRKGEKPSNVHVFPPEQRLKPSPPYADYEEVPSDERHESAKKKKRRKTSGNGDASPKNLDGKVVIYAMVFLCYFSAQPFTL